MGKNTKVTDDEPKPTVAKSALDLQRFKLEKLMKNPEKPVVIPERPRDKRTPHVPEFVRNVMGSSAGAGSGEFHVYRHLRRKEYARQKFIQEKSEKQLLEEAYHQKLLDNKQAAEEKTAKKRAKRLKKKANKKMKNQNPPMKKTDLDVKSDSESDDGSDEDKTDDHSGSMCDSTERTNPTFESPQTHNLPEENQSHGKDGFNKISSEASNNDAPLTCETNNGASKNGSSCLNENKTMSVLEDLTEESANQDSLGEVERDET